MNYSKLLNWSPPLSGYAALSGGVNGYGLGGMGAVKRGGFGSAGLLGSVRGYTFVNAEAAAVAAAFTTSPTNARKLLIDNYVGSLKSAGVWTELDVLYVMAAADAQAARINWKTPASFTLSPQNSPTFTADQGYQGDGATSYILTGYNPTGNGVKFVQDNASIWLWSRTAAAGTGSETDIGSGTVLLACRSSANQARLRANDGTTSTVASADGSGFLGSSRSSSGTKKAWRNGVQLGADIAIASTTLANANQPLCGSGVSFSIRQQSIAAWGSGVAGLEAAFYSATNTYMTAVGAA